MAKYGTKFRGMPILCYPFDTPDEIYNELERLGIDPQPQLNRYASSIMIPYLEPLLFNSSYKINLGGENEKQKIITTERTSGIFDFSLASKTLERDVEYYSEKLADEYPDRFQNMGLLSGIVPSDYVTNFPVQGQPKFIFQDEVLKKDFLCEQRQKGETAIENGVFGARLEYKSKTRKTYKTYKRQKGKVRYVEIYSLFYYTMLNGDVQYAIRHFPAILAAMYLEKLGIKTRIYVTRFVKIDAEYILNYRDSVNKLILPQYSMFNGRQFQGLFVEPFCVKDFGQEVDPLLGFKLSDVNGSFYDPLARYAMSRESDNTSVYGDPDWNEFQYIEGVERYKNKYKYYVDLGIYRSKEVLPEAMLFFHDYTIRQYLPTFRDEFLSYFRTQRTPNIDGNNCYQSPEMNIIFSWWMRLTAIKLKHKVGLLNSNSLVSDMSVIDKELEEIRLEAKIIIDSTQNLSLKELYKKWTRIFINGQHMQTLQEYILALNNEITAYAQDDAFQTTEDDIEKRDDFAASINDALNSYL